MNIFHEIKRIIACVLCFSLFFEQSGLAQISGQIDLSGQFLKPQGLMQPESSRPARHLRSITYNDMAESFKFLMDKGATGKDKTGDYSQLLLNYFLTGIVLPNSTFWVNLRPDSPDSVIDIRLAATDMGKVMLEADLQLKKDISAYVSLQTDSGREYWKRLYGKAEELFGDITTISIPTVTRPWIVPGEIMLRESGGYAHIYKARLMVMLEVDYLKNPARNDPADSRKQMLNEYSAELMRELIIPRINAEVNASKKYAALRQVFYSLILAQWFKKRFTGRPGRYPRMIDSNNLAGLTSRESWSPRPYFAEYKKCFEEGTCSFNETIYTSRGQAVRSYSSGGISFDVSVPSMTGEARAVAGSVTVYSARSVASLDGGLETVALRPPDPKTVRRTAVSRDRSVLSPVRLARSKRVMAGTLVLGAAIAGAILWLGIPMMAGFIATQSWFAMLSLASLMFMGLWTVLNVSATLSNIFLGQNAPPQPLPFPNDPSALPIVAVQITSRNEPFSVLRQTIQSALKIEYPREKFRIMIIDDSDVSRPEYAAVRNFYDTDPEIARLKSLYGENAVQFIHRQENRGYKGGALNDAMEFTDAEYFLLMDADSIVAPDICRKMVPEFIADYDLAFVQAKSLAYNADTSVYSRGINVLDEFFKDVYNPLQKNNGFPFFEGHNGMVNRRVLENVGGWPEDQPSEDFDFSIQAALQGKYGMWVDYVETGEQMPTTFDAIKTQRKRWAFGTTKCFLTRLAAILASTTMPWNLKMDIFMHVNWYLMSIPVVFFQSFGTAALVGTIMTGSVFNGSVLFVISLGTTFAMAALYGMAWIQHSIKDTYRPAQLLSGMPIAVTIMTAMMPISFQGVSAALMGVNEGFKITSKEKTASGSVLEIARKNRLIMGLAAVQLVPFVPAIFMGANLFGLANLGLMCIVSGVLLLAAPFLGKMEDTYKIIRFGEEELSPRVKDGEPSTGIVPMEDKQDELRGSEHQSEARADSLKDGGRDPGGIDFRSVPIRSCGVDIDVLFGGQSRCADPEAEWVRLQTMVNNGIIPSGERVREYVGAWYREGTLSLRSTELLRFMSDIFKIEESKDRSADPTMKDILVILEAA